MPNFNCHARDDLREFMHNLYIAEIWSHLSDVDAGL